jgi:hypothetical protein
MILKIKIKFLKKFLIENFPNETKYPPTKKN